MENNWQGIYAATATPFDNNDHLNEEEFAKLVRFHLEQGIDGCFLGGATGEGIHLSDDELLRLCRIAVEQSRRKGKVIAHIGGRPTKQCAQLAQEAAKLGAETEKIVLSQYKVNPCLGHDNCSSFESCSQKDDANWILDKFLNADGVILATPVYWYNVSAQMKAFIDRNYFPYKHDLKYKARAAGIIVVAEMEAIDDTLHTLNQFVDWCFDIETSRKFVASGYAHKIGDVRNNHPLVEEARKLGRQMAESLKE